VVNGFLLYHDLLIQFGFLLWNDSLRFDGLLLSNGPLGHNGFLSSLDALSFSGLLMETAHFRMMDDFDKMMHYVAPGFFLYHNSFQATGFLMFERFASFIRYIL